MQSDSITHTNLLSLFKLYYLFAILISWWIASQILNLFGANIEVLNKISLVIIFITCLGGFLRLVILNKLRLWLPITWFLLTSALYYGFGPSLYFLGNKETIRFLDYYYSVDDYSLFSTNSVALVGISLVIFFYTTFSGDISTKMLGLYNFSIKQNPFYIQKLWRIAIFFMVIGLPVKLLLTFPYSIGLIGWTLPGAVKSAENSSLLALIPLYAIKNVSLKYKFYFYFLVTINAVTSLFTLSKLSVILLTIVILMAAVLKGESLKRLAISGALVFFLYIAILSPMVSYGRLVYNRSGIQDIRSAIELFQDVLQNRASEYLSSISPGGQGWWSRLNYAPAQSFAINSYDSGYPGSSLDSTLWIIVPRQLYPEKPNLSIIGNQFNELVDGNPDSASSPGMITEGYWNFGWPGVILISLIMALSYSLWEKYIIYRLIRLDLQYLPVIFLGLIPAFQQDSWFVISMAGVLPIAIASHWLIKLFSSFFTSKDKAFSGLLKV